MAILGLPGLGVTTHTEPECAAGSEMDNTGAVTPQQQCLAEASSVGAVAVGRSDQTEKDVAAECSSTKPLRRSELQRHASRQNGKKSGGPRTARGKAISSQNAVTHGLLAKRLMRVNDENAKDFADVLVRLRQDLQPVGILEETLVERLAYDSVRIAAASKYCCDAALFVANTLGPGPGNLMRYESMIVRQFFQSMHQLERLQRLCLGENVPAPLNIQISHHTTATADEEK